MIGTSVVRRFGAKRREGRESELQVLPNDLHWLPLVVPAAGSRRRLSLSGVLLARSISARRECMDKGDHVMHQALSERYDHWRLRLAFRLRDRVRCQSEIGSSLQTQSSRRDDLRLAVGWAHMVRGQYLVQAVVGNERDNCDGERKRL